MSDFDLGTARGKVEIDTDSVQHSFGKASAAQGDFQRGSQQSADTMVKSGAVIAGAGVVIAGAIGFAVKTAADFETRISAIAAVSGATGDEIDKLREKALQLGADTKFSASEAASAMEELVKAGLSTTDVLEGAADATVALAAAGEIDLPAAATIAANAMNAFGLAAQDMPRIADLIAGAANASAIDVGEFGQSLQQAGAVANLVGLSFDDLSVAIAAMGNAGIKGSDAGTSLKTFLSNLQPVTEKQITLFKDLGLTLEDGTNAFFDANGQIKSMRDISGTLAGALAGMTDQQKQLTLETLFGSDAIRAAAIIAETGAEGFDTLADSMGKVSAADVAAKRMDNLGGSIEQLKGSLETLLIRAGSPFQGVIRGIVDALTGFINILSSAPPQVQKLVAIIAAATAGALIFGGGLIALVGFIQKAKIAFIALRAVMLANPFILIATVLIALGAAFVAAYQSSEKFREVVDGVFSWISDFVKPVIDEIVVGIQALIAAFNDPDVTSSGFVGMMEQIGVIARNVWDFIQSTIIPGFRAFWEVLQGEGETGSSGFIGFMERLGTLVLEVGGFIKDTIVPAVQDAVEVFGGWGNVLKVVGLAIALIVAPWLTLGAALVYAYVRFEAFRKVVNKVAEILVEVGKTVVAFGKEFVETSKEIFNWLNDNVFPTFVAFGELVAVVVKRIIDVWETLWPYIQIVLNIIMGIIKAFIQTISILWDAFGSKIWSAIQLAFNIVKTIVESVLGVIRGVIQTITGLISGDWDKAWQGIKEIFSSVWEAIKAIPKLAMEAIKLAIETILAAIGAAWDIFWNTIKSAFSILWQSIKGIVTEALSSVVQTVRDRLGEVVSWFVGLPGRILGALGDGFRLLLQWGRNIISGTWQGIREIWDHTIAFIRGIPGMILGAIPNPLELLKNVGRDIIQGLINGVKSLAGSAVDAVKGVGGGIVGGVKKLFGVGSPSKVFEQIGVWNIEGLIKGMKDIRPVIMQVEEIAKVMVSPFDSGGSSIPLAPPTGATTGSINITFAPSFPNIRSGADAEQAAAALTTPEVLKAITNSIRAGVGR